MKLGFFLIVTSACTIAPKLVAVPMSDTVATTSITTDPGASENHDDDAAPDSTEDFSGSWAGTAWGVGNKTWPMIVTFEKRGARELVAHVSYPDRRCRADWSLHHAPSAPTSHWEGSESVKIDPIGLCVTNARILVDVVDEDTVRTRWVLNGTASATLQRQQ
jgi:hypothetical protein